MDEEEGRGRMDEGKGNEVEKESERRIMEIG